MTSEITVRSTPSLDPVSIGEAKELAKAAFESKLYAVASPAAALMILLTGRDLGLTASQSLRAVYVVSGKPVVSSDAMVAAIRKSGLCDSWRVLETTAERCTIETRRRGEEHAERETFTLEDAKRARLDAKDVWRMYPRDMLRHRCAAGLARRVYPDVILGCYAPGEIDDARTADSMPAQHTPIDAATVEAEAEAKYQSGAPAPQAPPADGRDPRTTPQFLALVDALAAADSTESVVAAWLAHGSSLVGAGSDVFVEGKKETRAAWVAFGGENSMDALGAAVKAAREAAPRKAEVSTVGPRNAEAAPADEKPRARSRKAQNAAPLDRSVVEYLAPIHWRERIERDADAGHIAGGYHKRAAQWRSSGDLARVRAITVDRLCALLATDDRSASAWLDGCAPGKRAAL